MHNAMFPSKRLAVNGTTLNVIDVGNGAPVLLVHGFPDTHAVWREQIPVLLAAGYRVIAPDTRGCGESELMPALADYRLDRLIGDLVGILDTLGIAKVRLVGHDWGAAIGWQLAMVHPERVERFVALSVGHPDAFADAGLAQKLRSWYMILFQWRGVAEWWLRQGNWAAFARFAGYPDEVPNWVRNLARPGRLTAGLNYYRANFRQLMTRWQPRIAVPVVGIYSDGDRFLTRQQMQRSAAYCDVGFRYLQVTGANHWLQLHKVQDFNPLLLDALA